jgi:hypothetical protein
MSQDEAAQVPHCPDGCPLEAMPPAPARPEESLLAAAQAAMGGTLQEAHERGLGELRQMAMDAARRVAYKYTLTARLAAGSVGPAAEAELSASLAELCGLAPEWARDGDGRACGVLWRLDCYRKALAAQEALMRCQALRGLWMESERQPPKEEKAQEAIGAAAAPAPPMPPATPRAGEKVPRWEDAWL